jgi:hypothetical protein
LVGNHGGRICRVASVVVVFLPIVPTTGGGSDSGVGRRCVTKSDWFSYMWAYGARPTLRGEVALRFGENGRRRLNLLLLVLLIPLLTLPEIILLLPVILVFVVLVILLATVVVIFPVVVVVVPILVSLGFGGRRDYVA